MTPGMYGTLEQKKRHQKNAGLGVGLGIACLFGSVAVIVMFGNSASETAALLMFLIVRLAGVVLWFWGLSEYAKGKGYSGSNAWWGLAGIIGLLVLLSKKDQFIVGDPPTQGAYPRYPNATY